MHKERAAGGAPGEPKVIRRDSQLLLERHCQAASTDGRRLTVRMVTGLPLCDKSYDYVIAVEGTSVRYIPQDSDPAPR